MVGAAQAATQYTLTAANDYSGEGFFEKFNFFTVSLVVPCLLDDRAD
jgi:hypothetical protein